MTERRTGATPEQIEAAAKRHSRQYAGAWDLNVAEARQWAGSFAPPDHRIVGPAFIGALSRVLLWIERNGKPNPSVSLLDDLALLSAALDDE